MDIESQPAAAGDSIKPGVKRSGTPGDCPKIRPARGAGDSGYHDFKAVARSAGCGPWMCCSWGSATLHPRLYAIARYRGLARTRLSHLSVWPVATTTPAGLPRWGTGPLPVLIWVAFAQFGRSLSRRIALPGPADGMSLGVEDDFIEVESLR
jgi:hypothetical protein